jgi:glutathione synthase
MKLLFVVNSIPDVVPTMTTAMLIRGAAERGDEVFVCGVDQLELSVDGRLRALAAKAPRSASPAELCTALRAAPVEAVDVEDCGAWLLRTNPARDTAGAHGPALNLARAARERGVVVLNDPDGLVRAQSKLYLAERVPARFRPQTLVSRDAGRLAAFVKDSGGRCVLKPLSGTRGNDVFFVDERGDNLKQIISVVARSGYAMAQTFVPAAVDGDTRVVLLEGQILERGGHPAAIKRVPGKGDFRSNLHTGGKAEPAVITEGMRACVEAIGPSLVEDGLFLVGVDFVGDQVLEINVFATGGFRDAERFSGLDLIGDVLAAVERRVGERVAC